MIGPSSLAMASTHTVLEHAMATSPPMPLVELPAKPKDIWTSVPARQITRSATYTYIPALRQSSDGQRRSSHSIGHGHVGRSDKRPAHDVERPRTGQLEVTSEKTNSEPATSNESNIRIKPFGTDAVKASEKHEPVDVDAGSHSTSPPDPPPKPGTRPCSPANTESTGSSQEDKSSSENASSSTSQSPSISPPSPAIPAGPPNVEPRPKQLSMRRSMLSLKAARPLSNFLRGSAADSAISEVGSMRTLPTSLSTDRIPSLMKTFPVERVRPIPRPKSSHNLQALGRSAPRKKDELWSVFRTLDSDFHK